MEILQQNSQSLELRHRPNGPSISRLPSRPSRRFPRTKNGCLTCRQRKKKCDQVHPRCAGCVRNKLSCQWPDIEQKATSVEVVVDEEEEGNLELSKHLPKTELTLECTDKSYCSLVVQYYELHRQTKSLSTNYLALSPHHISNAYPLQWNHTLGAFASTAKATFITPSSNVFLQYYIANTGPLLASVPPGENPFITCLIPLAYSDDLVMHCLMALGGAHLGSYTPDSRPITSESSSPADADTAVHYSCAMRGVRSALVEIKDGVVDREKTLRTLLVVLLMAEIETISKTCLSGIMFRHLFAARELINLILKDHDGTSHIFATHESNYLFTLSMEIYSYLMIVNLIGPADDTRTQTGLSKLTPISLETLETMDGFGTIFNGCQTLLSFLPEISALWSSSRDLQDCDGEYSTTIARADAYASLRSRIMYWQHPLSKTTGTAREKVYDPNLQAVVEVWRHGLAVYLEAAYADTQPLSQLSRLLMREHVSKATDLIMDTHMVDSHHVAILTWPMVILGSCVESPSRREVLVDRIKDTRLRTWSAIGALEVLKLLWCDMNKDERSFGPYGLHLAMRKNGVQYSVA